MKRRVLLWSAALASIGIVLGFFSLKRFASVSTTRPIIYGQEDVVRFLNRNGLSIDVVDTVVRNASGDELFVSLFPTANNKLEALRITTNGIKRISSPGRRVFAPAEDDFGAWLTKTGDTVVFRGGSSIQLPQFALFDLDPSGRYFVVGEKPSRTWVGRTNSPNDQQLLAEDVLGSRVFANGEHLYVCGTTPSAAAVCLVVADDRGRFRVTDRHTFEWAAGIVDVDPDANRLLLWNNHDLFTTAYVYDLETKRRSRVGGVKGFELFLKHDLLGR